MSLQVITMEELNTVLDNRFSKIETLISLIGGSKKTEEYLTRKEVCEMLKIDKSTLWRWTKEGLIAAYGAGNRVYYKRSEIEAALEQNKIN